MPSDELLHRCIAGWTAEGIPLAPPIAEDEIRRVWDRFGQRVSSDVLRLYGTIGGFAEYVLDDEFLWCLWPWQDLLGWNAVQQGPGVEFCDHSIKVVTWGLRFEDDDRSSVWRHDAQSPGNFHRTAPTLDAFFQMYLDDPWQLL